MKTELVTIQEAKAVTSSLQVAQTFGKRHSDVIRSIESIITQLAKNECKRIFALTYIQVKQPNGGYRNEACYLISRDGFTLLAMGFTGKKALQFKIDYINAFNQMEEYIKKQSAQPTLPKRKATGKRVETYLPNEDVLRLQIAAYQAGYPSVYSLLQDIIYFFFEYGTPAEIKAQKEDLVEGMNLLQQTTRILKEKNESLKRNYSELQNTLIKAQDKLIYVLEK